MSTPAMINIEEIVSRYLFKYKLSLDDAFIYTEHACDAYKTFRLYDSHEFVTARVTFTTNRWLEMPNDMQTFVDLCVPINGGWWSFTERREIVHTTTFTGLVEGRDSTLGEGADLSEPRTTGYAAAGGVNDYNYKLDWEARRIFIEGVSSGTGVLLYTSSGIEVSGVTLIPDMLIPMIDAYLKWKSSYWIPELIRERMALEKDFTNTRLAIRNLINAYTYNEWRDLLLSSAVQAPQR